MYPARIINCEDLNWQLVKSTPCSVMIPQCELTVPPSCDQLTAVEGLIRDDVTDLSVDQPPRQYQDENAYTKIQSMYRWHKDRIKRGGRGGDWTERTEGKERHVSFIHCAIG